MRRPRKTPPLKVWVTPYYRVELHRQTVGYVLWANNKHDREAGWVWGAYEAREDAEEEAREHYGVEPCHEEASR